MILIKEKQKYIFCAVMLYLLISIDVYAGDLLPGGLKIQDSYKNSAQPVAGNVQEVTGQVFIIHSDNPEIGYKAKAGFNIFEKDTIISRADGQLRLVFNDGSTVSIASGTRLVINESVYKPEEKVRKSFLTMIIGKAHFIVKKLPGYNKKDFQVKTKTAVVGVRGSEFVIESLVSTIITTLADTVLWVENLQFPEQGIKVDSFMRTVIGEKELPSTPEAVIPEDIQQEIREFFLAIPKEELAGIDEDQVTIKRDLETDTLIIEIENIEPELVIDLSEIIDNIEELEQDLDASDLIHKPEQPEIPDHGLTGATGGSGGSE